MGGRACGPSHAHPAPRQPLQPLQPQEVDEVNRQADEAWAALQRSGDASGYVSLLERWAADGVVSQVGRRGPCVGAGG
jgi:hypothetical protein